MTQTQAAPDRTHYLGLGIVAGCTVVLEIILTRLFSILVWYHMALVSVAMTMLGLAVGAVIVHYFSHRIPPTRTRMVSGWAALGFSCSLVLSLGFCLQVPFSVAATMKGITFILFWNAVIALPFCFSGVIICVLLTRFPASVGGLYAADLAGAALGCLAVILLLNTMDAPSAILAVSTLIGAAGALFLVKRSRVLALVLTALLFGLTLTNLHSHPFRIRYSFDQKLGLEPVRHELWNVFSYVRVSHPIRGRFYWGKGDQASWSGASANEFLKISMDVRATTPLIRVTGDWEDLTWLNFDATNLVHQVRPEGQALVVGSGGGRDILSALLPNRGTREVIGLDINPHMMDLLQKHEAVYFGRIAEIPNLKLYTHEARSWIERSPEHFEVITIPLVDTSAASAAGAYALTENNLYTVEAFQSFVSHLNPTGVLSVSRWWYLGLLGESHRLVGLAAESLRSMGVEEPHTHLFVAHGRNLATLLVFKEPIGTNDLRLLEEACRHFGFQILLSPNPEGMDIPDPHLIAAAIDSGWWTHYKPLDLSPPTDDRPFFFHSFKITNFLFEPWREMQIGVAHQDRNAMVILGVLILGVSGLALGFVIFSYAMRWLSPSPRKPPYRLSSLGFFGAIGLAFLLLESAQIQRFNIFLGHPVYALSVVLFSLLLSSAAGSLAVQMAQKYLSPKNMRLIVPVAFFILVGICFLTPLALQGAWKFGAVGRIGITAILVATAGFFMGMYFPLGVHIITQVEGQANLSWYWAVNGFTSVCASVYAIAFSISLGVNATSGIALFCYACASLLYLRADHSSGVKV